MKRSEYTTEFLSEDLCQCSYLIEKKHKILGAIRLGHKVAIRFNKTPAVENDALQYYNGTACRLFDNYRRLKALVFQVLREQE